MICASENSLSEGLVHLSAVDGDLERIIAKEGAPPLWERTPGFPSLVHIILEQQVSLASARATFDKLVEILPQLEPCSFLAINDDVLRQIGFSRQKSRYTKHLAGLICNGSFSLSALASCEDDHVKSQMTQITGIGAWTADIYLLMALRRPDIWPVGDLALVKSVMHVKKLDARPQAVEMEMIARPWKPWRSVAARVLWNHYIYHM